MRRSAAALGVSLVVGCANGGAPPRDDGMPASMAALGDSITRAYLACGQRADCPAVSWSTGGDVDSHARRLERLTGTPVETHNLAVSGATVADLAEQSAAAVRARAEYVTVLIGANDVCRPTADAMTPAEDFARLFGAALARLAGTRVLVVSVPDVTRLWEVADDAARATWAWLGICRTALAPHAPRGEVRARIQAYNAAMAAACARQDGCRYDGGAVFAHDFTLGDVTSADYWHPGEQGQQTLAEVTWAAGFWPPG